MRLNRAYQREILSRLAEDYPDIDDKNKAWFENEFEQNGRTYACNVSYLIVNFQRFSTPYPEVA